MQCYVCGKEGKKLCGQCCVARYCSRECQKADWPKHKIQCKDLVRKKTEEFAPIMEEISRPADYGHSAEDFWQKGLRLAEEGKLESAAEVLCYAVWLDNSYTGIVFSPTICSAQARPHTTRHTRAYTLTHSSTRSSSPLLRSYLKPLPLSCLLSSLQEGEQMKDYARW